MRGRLPNGGPDVEREEERMKVRCYCDIMDGDPAFEERLNVTVEATAKAFGNIYPNGPGSTRYWFT